MEEQILKMILEKDFIISERELKSLSKEIAIHFVLFTEWCIEWTYFEEPNYYLIVLFDRHDKPLGTLLEVYQYWLTNIKTD